MSDEIPHHSFGDVPIKIAMIAWNPVRGGDGRIQIIPHPDDRDWTSFLKLRCTDGACWGYWGKAPKHKQLLKLYIEGWHIVCRDGLSPHAVHAAFMVIPEYRETMSGETFFWGTPHATKTAREEEE